MGKFILRTQPMIILVVSLKTSLDVLVVGPLHIGFVGVPKALTNAYATYFGMNCGLTFLPLERNRAHLLPQLTVLFPHLLFLLTLPSHHVQTLTLLLGKSIKTPNDHVFSLYLLACLIFRHLKKTMPISINNSLPSVNFLLGLTMEADNGMRILVDTGTAINSGYLDYHLWVMSQCPEMVAEFLQCGPDTDYDVV